MKNESQNNTIKYITSFAISITISIINAIIQFAIGHLTRKEKNYCMTDLYWSNSIKLQIFTFINSAIIPVIVNAINGNWNNKDILVNNAMSILLLNAILTPTLRLFDLEYFFKLLKRCLLERRLRGLNQNEIDITQKEANLIFENNSLCIDYKFSFVGKTSLITFFYIPIFPVGILISLGGLIYVTLVDKV